MTGKPDAAEALLGVLFVVVSALSLLGMALAEAGALTAPAIAIAGAVIVVGAIAWTWRAVSRQRVSRTSRLDWVVLAGLFAVSFAALRPPMEALVDAGDASVYLGIGQLVAEKHSLRPVDAVTASLAPDLKAQLFARDPMPPPLLNYFPGGLQLTTDGKIEPSFFHLTPVWMAMFDLAFGSRGGVFAGLFFATLAMPIAWAIGRRLAGTWTGVAAAALILANFGEQHFARWPCSEIVAQYFSLAAVWWLMVSIDNERATWASLAAGLAVGLAAFTRVDALMATALPVIGWLAVVAAIERADRWQRITALFTATMVTTYAIAHAWVFSNAYSRRVLSAMSFVQRRYPRFVWGTIAAAIMLGVVYLAYVRGGVRIRRAIAGVLAVAAIALLLIAGARVAGSVLEPLLTVPGIIIAFAGIAAMLVRMPVRRAMPLIVVFFGSALLYLQHRLDVTGALLVFRRCVPVLLPLGAVLMAYAFSTMARLGPIFKGLAVAGVVAFVVVFGALSRVVFAARLFDGEYERVATIARELPETSLTIVDPQTPSHLALALRSAFGRSVVLVSGQADGDALARLSAQVLAERRSARLLVPSSHESRTLQPNQFAPMTIRALDRFPLEIVEFDPASRTLPGSVISVERELELYAIEPPARVTLPLVMNLGPRDFSFAGAGWQPAETMRDVSARWTDGAGQLIMPAVDQPPDTIAVVVVAAGTRPANLAPPSVQLSIAGVVLGSFVADRPGFAKYRLGLSREQTAALCRGGLLLIRSDAFVPARLSNSDDRRRLGIAVDRVEVIK